MFALAKLAKEAHAQPLTGIGLFCAYLANLATRL